MHVRTGGAGSEWNGQLFVGTAIDCCRIGDPMDNSRRYVCTTSAWRVCQVPPSPKRAACNGGTRKICHWFAVRTSTGSQLDDPHGLTTIEKNFTLRSAFPAS